MKKEVDPFIFLPDDILLDIFRRLPDFVLSYKAKYVCRRWFNIITNNIVLADASFILQNINGMRKARIVGIKEEQQGLKGKEQNFYKPSGKIESWYNEFLLMMDPSIKKPFYILNLITNKRSYLPKCHSHTYYCKGAHHNNKCGAALCFDGSKGVYKVVHIFMGPPFECHVLILGREIVSCLTSNWKKVEVPWLVDYYMQDCWYALVSVQVQGRYFHWNVHCNYLVSMDMVKEEVLQMSLPGSDDDMYNLYSIFDMGGFLTLIDGVSMGKTDIWILKDFQMMKWEKLYSMEVPDYYIKKYPVSCFLSPICGVIGKRYIIFMKRSSRMCWSYDMKNRVVKELNIRIEDGDCYMVRSSAPNLCS